MTDTTTPLPRVSPGYIYKGGDGVLLMATGTTSVQPLKGGAARYLSPDIVFHAAIGGTPWNDAMTDAWRSLVDEVAALKATRQGLISRYEELGQALLEKAEQHGWCSEYEDFAEEWDLPKRTRDYDVTITVRVEARDGEEAQTLALKDFREYGYDVEVQERTD